MSSIPFVSIFLHPNWGGLGKIGRKKMEKNEEKMQKIEKNREKQV